MPADFSLSDEIESSLKSRPWTNESTRSLWVRFLLFWLLFNTFFQICSASRSSPSQLQSPSSLDWEGTSEQEDSESQSKSAPIS